MQTLDTRPDIESFNFLIPPSSSPSSCLRTTSESADSVPNLSSFVSTLELPPDAGSAVAVRLPVSVTRALEQINSILSVAPQRVSSSVTPEIRLPLSTGENDKAHACIEALSRELTALYYPDLRSDSDRHGDLASHIVAPEHLTHVWYRCLAIICEHFRQMGSYLQSTGHSRCFIAGTRNSFADHFHVHDFYTYILYCGREAGTEVIPGDLESNHLALEQRKDSWQRHTHRVRGISSPPPPSYTSDTSHGLLIPPLVAHRACRSALAHTSTNANLALVMTVFRGNKENHPGNI